MSDTHGADSATPSPAGNQLSDGQLLDELARSENPADYIAERADQDAAESAQDNPEETQTQRRASRYERLKRARDAAMAENAELRKRLGEPSQDQPREDAPGAPDEAERQDEDAQDTTQDDAIELGRFQARASEFAKTAPDFVETVLEADRIVNLPDHITRQLRRSEHGPQLAYALSKDLLEGSGIMMDIEAMSATEFAHFLGRWEAALENRKQADRSPQPTQRRVTKAPPPLRPIGGGSAGPSRDLHSLAKSDNIDDYVRARRGQRDD